MPDWQEYNSPCIILTAIPVKWIAWLNDVQQYSRFKRILAATFWFQNTVIWSWSTIISCLAVDLTPQLIPNCTCGWLGFVISRKETSAKCPLKHDTRNSQSTVIGEYEIFRPHRREKARLEFSALLTMRASRLASGHRGNEPLLHAWCDHNLFSVRATRNQK